MYTKKDNIHQRWVYVAHATSAPDQDGWAHVTGVYSLEQIQAGAQYVYIYYGGTDVAYDMVLDNMEMKYLPKQCLDLVLNPDFSDSSAFWETNDGNVVKLSFVNGAGGEGDSAMRVHRTSTWNGHAMRQRLDHMCFGEGDTYIISAKFRLLDAASGDALDCNTNTNQYSSNTCPSVRLVGNSCTTGGDPWGNVYQVSVQVDNYLSDELMLLNSHTFVFYSDSGTPRPLGIRMSSTILKLPLMSTLQLHRAILFGYILTT